MERYGPPPGNRPATTHTRYGLTTAGLQRAGCAGTGCPAVCAPYAVDAAGRATHRREWARERGAAIVPPAGRETGPYGAAYEGNTASALLRHMRREF